jgi:Domain of unknown function (DUF4365)
MALSRQETRMPKRFPATAQLARQGVDLCASVVHNMGHIWREKGISDVGIDGEIELVDPSTRAVLGRMLLVQSKARSVPFDHETDDGFSFRCTEDDLEYWLSASAPVVLVCSHPKEKRAWFKNVSAWFGEQPNRRPESSSSTKPSTGSTTAPRAACSSGASRQRPASTFGRRRDPKH